MITNNTKRNGHEKVNLIIDMRAVRNDGGAAQISFYGEWCRKGSGEKTIMIFDMKEKESLRDERGPEDLHGDGGDRQGFYL